MRRNLLRDDRGSVSIMILTMATTVSLLLVLVIDASARIKAATEADTYSAEGARAAAIAIGPVPTGTSLDTANAVAAAKAFLAKAGLTGSAIVTGPSQVSVTVTITKVSPVGGTNFTATRTHVAQLQIGVTTGRAP